MRGAQSNVWFDRHKISQDCPEHLESIDSMCDDLSAIVQEEIRAGIRNTGWLLVWLLAYLSLSSPSIYLSLPTLLLSSVLHTRTLHLFQIKQSLRPLLISLSLVV